MTARQFPSVKVLNSWACLLVGMLLSASLLAQTGSSLREKLDIAIVQASGNQLQITSISPTPLPNVYQVELSTGEILYSDASGDYLFAGDMYQTTATGLLNMTAGIRQARNVEKIADIPEEEMIIFSPEQTRATLTVFTDVDCTFCRKLHGDIEEILAQGIEIRYLAYPRGGERATSFNKMISVWCSDDRKKTLSQAKNGQNLPESDCDTPVLEHYALGNAIGITGTPALIFPDGRVIPGYMDVENLVALLGLN